MAGTLTDLTSRFNDQVAGIHDNIKGGGHRCTIYGLNNAYAALIDGPTPFQLLWRIIVPLSVPAIVGVGIFQGSLVWNELIVSLTVLQNEELYTVPLTLATFLRRFVREWSLTFSTLFLSMVPIVVVYIIFNRHFVRGMTVGAVKG